MILKRILECEKGEFVDESLTFSTAITLLILFPIMNKFNVSLFSSIILGCISMILIRILYYRIPDIFTTIRIKKK